MKNRSALHFVLIIGIANFFADFTYEGARGIIGPFLGSLGASAAIVGLVAGLGELMGYGLRSVSGYFADKSHKHWAFAFVGYTINMLAVPALALTSRWPLAASLVVSERIGRGIRKPTVEAMLSYAGRSIGAGWVFGLNEALDQAGATIGPLLMALILYLNGGYRTGFATLLIPALLCLGTLVLARLLHPRPHELEKGIGHAFTTTNLTQAYWIYLAAGALLAAGFADFALIGFHFQKANVVRENLIPVFYAVAMAASALASIPLGRLFDRFGPKVSLFAFLDFRGGCAVRFSRNVGLRIDWNDFLGSRDERAGFAVSSDAYRRHSAAETKHSFWLVRYRIRNRMVFRKRSDGLAIRHIDSSCGTILSHSSTCCCARSFYRQ